MDEQSSSDERARCSQQAATVARQATADSLQCSRCKNFSHSSAHVVQISMHNRHTCNRSTLLPGIAFNTKVQATKAVWFNLRQRVKIKLSSSNAHALEQRDDASTQASSKRLNNSGVIQLQLVLHKQLYNYVKVDCFLPQNVIQITPILIEFTY